jgi:hypothetical protein
MDGFFWGALFTDVFLEGMIDSTSELPSTGGPSWPCSELDDQEVFIFHRGG